MHLSRLFSLCYNVYLLIKKLRQLSHKSVGCLFIKLLYILFFCHFSVEENNKSNTTMLPGLPDQIPFPDVLANQELPITLDVAVDCKLYEKTVLEQGQRITVIDRSNLDVLCGRDWNNNKVNIGKTQVIDYEIEIVEELYPTTISIS